MADDHDADRRRVEHGAEVVLAGRGACRVAGCCRRRRGRLFERIRHQSGQHAADQHLRHAEQTRRDAEDRARRDADADGVDDDERIGAAQSEHQRIADPEDREPGHEVDDMIGQHRRDRDQQRRCHRRAEKSEPRAGAVDHAEQAEGAAGDGADQHRNRDRPHRRAQQVVSTQNHQQQWFAARHQPAQLLGARGVGGIREAVHHVDLKRLDP